MTADAHAGAGPVARGRVTLAARADPTSRAEATSKADPLAEKRARAQAMSRADARNFAIAEGSNDVDSDELVPDIENEGEALPISDQFADGWEDAEHDPSTPNDDWVSDAWPFSRRRRPIIQFFRAEDGALHYQVANRNHWAHARMQYLGDIEYRETKHNSFARELLDHQAAAIEASSARDAYRLAKHIKGSSYTSKSRGELIGCLWGTAPLQFLLKWPPKSADDYDKMDVYNNLFDLMLARFRYLKSSGWDASSREQLLALPEKVTINRKPYASYLAYLDATQPEADQLADGEPTFLTRIALRNDKEWASVPRPLAKYTHIINKLVSVHRHQIELLRRHVRNWTDDSIRSHDDLCHTVTKEFGRGMEVAHFAVAGWEPAQGKDWYLVEERDE